ncbi:acyltransferase 3 [Cercophora scortea]|uniref:Acyltransferase 3 n=1 Tax=Cercophora scortea TaxID=314031 RepID=A0AAE0J621_9PEZI|nr:acyltransferase 3 [Cercophora scortea]
MPPPTSNPRPGRRHDLDNLRTVCTSLVIATHTAASYAGGGGAPPHSACFDKPSQALLPFIATNYAYGLALFFWLSGQMSAQSLAKTKDWEFVKSKLWRLGLPTLLYSAFLDPLRAVAMLKPGADLNAKVKAYLAEFRNFKGAPGSVWYTATLLIFDLCAVVLRRCFALWNGRGDGFDKSEFSRLARLYGLLSRWGWIGAAAGSFLVGTKYPPGKPMPWLFVQPSCLLQYIYAYTLGHMAYHLGRPRMTGMFDRLSLTKAVALSVGTLPILLLPGYLRGGKKPESDKTEEEKKRELKGDEKDFNLGGWTWTAALYATWTEFTFNTVAPAMMLTFYEKHTKPSKARLWGPRYAFAAYLLHSPVSWFINERVDALLVPNGKKPAWMSSKLWEDLGPILMTGAVGALDVVASFGTGLLLIDYVPGAGHIL